MGVRILSCRSLLDPHISKGVLALWAGEMVTFPVGKVMLVGVEDVIEGRAISSRSEGTKDSFDGRNVNLRWPTRDAGRVGLEMR